MMDSHAQKRIEQLEKDVRFWMDECRLKVLSVFHCRRLMCYFLVTTVSLHSTEPSSRRGGSEARCDTQPVHHAARHRRPASNHQPFGVGERAS